eukprot:8710866-Alexandrium_andersonii.AAC.1
MPPLIGPGQNEVVVFSIGVACSFIGAADDSVSLRGGLARVLGKATYPEPAMLARASEDDFKQEIANLGYYIDRAGEAP